MIICISRVNGPNWYVWYVLYTLVHILTTKTVSNRHANLHRNPLRRLTRLHETSYHYGALDRVKIMPQITAVYDFTSYLRSDIVSRRLFPRSTHILAIWDDVIEAVHRLHGRPGVEAKRRGERRGGHPRFRVGLKKSPIEIIRDLAAVLDFTNLAKT